MTSRSDAALRHITLDGERWDSLAWRYYGSANAFERILRANPDLAMHTVLPSGLTVWIPVVELENIVPVEELPPWKR